jgi:hypothetical protein
MDADRVVVDQGRSTSRHRGLLLALLGFHLAAPAAQMLSPAATRFVLFPLYLVVLTSAILVMSSRSSRVLIVTLSLPLVAAGLVGSSEPERGALLLSASTLPFLGYTAGVVLRSVLAPGVIDQARLLGSASVFILSAQAWAGLYAGLELLTPGTFAIPGTAALRAGDLGYFSLVTQTTLGFGDIIPTTPIARAAVTLQAAAGLFYMGVIVARFAGRLRLGDPTPSASIRKTTESERDEHA